MSELFVESLHIHPVKSTAAQNVDVLSLTSNGADGDRRYLVIDENDHAITARDVPGLVLARAEITDKGLHLTAPGMSDLDVGAEETSFARVTIWMDAVDELLIHEEASRWFSDYLGRSCRLVRVTPKSSRTGVRKIIPNAFQDGGPVLVANTASLEDLNARLDQSVTMTHFRPNIVIAGAPAFDEDYWARFRIGDVVFEGLYGCSRCVFTTIDPVTSAKLKKGEPLRTLAKFRQGNDNQVYFGQNSRVTGDGSIRIGDKVEILERLPGLISLGDYLSQM